ncbi:MAG: hypothetical protein HY056_07905 [Proteobacteria bacterium]|nr:hypothetical protein [Pseudomonadota bacterium]
MRFYAHWEVSSVSLPEKKILPCRLPQVDAGRGNIARYPTLREANGRAHLAAYEALIAIANSSSPGPHATLKLAQNWA